MRSSIKWAALAVVGVVMSGASAMGYSFRDYYVALDGRPDQTGALINHPNPNGGRLTLLFAHAYPNVWQPLSFTTNHFHRVGFYSHVVPANTPPFSASNPVPAGQALSTTFGNARLPEGSYPAIKLIAGAGGDSMKFSSINRPHTLNDRSTEYDNLSIASIHEMAPFAGTDTGSQATATGPVNAMYFSSRFGTPATPRFTRPLTDITVGLQLVSKSAGLNIIDGLGNPILLNVGDVASLGDGNSFVFNPTFWADLSVGDATALSASFKLVDLNAAGGFTPESGVFRFDFVTVIPEPATLGLLAGVGLLALRRR